ncbi:hypothetical protein [Plantibacter sp. LMC-P-059a]|uniref:hypothetical protein n=1 Tax=Plantibacter sp. LMC-P-059a TaxID=3040297 RepID=UPI00254F13F5|nr:hypothetical protein [Plantibacter sp. LMC-P-059a]
MAIAARTAAISGTTALILPIGVDRELTQAVAASPLQIESVMPPCAVTAASRASVRLVSVVWSVVAVVARDPESI